MQRHWDIRIDKNRPPKGRSNRVAEPVVAGNVNMQPMRRKSPPATRTAAPMTGARGVYP